MRKLRMHLFIYLVAFLFASLGVAVSAGNSGDYGSKGDPAFKAWLTGRQETPPVKTKAKGEVILKLEKKGTELTYILKVKDIENVTAAHLHAGKKGEEGPPVANLFTGPTKTGKFSGVLAKGSVTDTDLIGPLAGKTIKDLVDKIKAGGIYVNVHTEKYVNGEIRGQVK